MNVSFSMNREQVSRLARQLFKVHCSCIVMKQSKIGNEMAHIHFYPHSINSYQYGRVAFEADVVLFVAALHDENGCEYDWGVELNGDLVLSIIEHKNVLS